MLPLLIADTQTSNPSRRFGLRPARQKTSLRPNCNCRIGIVLRVLLIVPKAPLPRIGTPAPVKALLLNDVLGSPKLGWFKRLNASTRNCRYFRSEKLNFLSAEESMPNMPGPVNVLRPRFP